jgi:hypothetical protein
MASIKARMMFFFLAGCATMLICASHASAGCALPAEPIKPALLERFEQQPKALFSAFPRGGDAMSEATLQMAVRNPKTIAQLLAIVPKSSATQQIALGVGLRRFVAGCAGRDPDVVRTIRLLVATQDIPAMRRAFYKADNFASATAPIPPGSKRPALLLTDLGSPKLGDILFEPSPDPFGRIEEWR